MRIPAHDRPLDDAEWRGFLDAAAFGTLVVAGDAPEDLVVHPTPYVVDDEAVLMHTVVGADVLEAVAEGGRGVLCVVGDVAFVPSAWKAVGDEDARLGIPTTYFAAVAVHGRIDVLDDPEAIADLLRRQLGWFQPDVDVADPLEAHARRVGQLRGLVLSIERVEARFKFGGNVDAAHRRHVAELLEARGAPADLAAAARARTRTPPGGSAFRR